MFRVARQGPSCEDTYLTPCVVHLDLYQPARLPSSIAHLLKQLPGSLIHMTDPRRERGLWACRSLRQPLVRPLLDSGEQESAAVQTTIGRSDTRGHADGGSCRAF